MHALVLFGGLISIMIVLLFVGTLQPVSQSYTPCRPYGRLLLIYLSIFILVMFAGAQDAYVPQPARSLPPTHHTLFYWLLWAALCVPDALTFARSMRHVLFRCTPAPSFPLFLAVRSSRFVLIKGE